jgi:hypothetical protein
MEAELIHRQQGLQQPILRTALATRLPHPPPPPEGHLLPPSRPPLLKWLYMVFIRGAILDGRAGLTYATLQSFYEYLIVLKTIAASRCGDSLYPFHLQEAHVNLTTSRHSLKRPNLSLFGLLFVLIATLGQTISLTAQTYRGGITGSVTDNSGATIAGAAVTATEDATNTSFKAVSTSAGEFEFANLTVGSYTVTVSMNGFSTAKYDKVLVAAGGSYNLAAKLAISSSAETVEVTAASLTLDTVTDVQGTVLPEVIVQNLPNSGRDFTQMVSQTTGFAGLSTGGGAGVASVNGTRSNSVNWQIQGTDNNDLWWNIPAINQGGVSAIAGVVFPIDAIENFSFVTSGEVQLGRNSGGTANLTVKSGGNGFHGTAYDFNHNEFFEHTNPFLTSKAASRLLDYGFSVGGSVFKDKLFFFGAGEHQNFLIGAENSATEPSAQYQKNAYAVLDAYGVAHSKVAANLLNGNGTLPGLWPTSALTGGAGGGNYTASGNLTGHSFNGVIHLDANLTDKDKLSAIWSVGQGTQTAPTSSTLTPYFENAPIHVQNYSLIYNRTITSSIANQLGAGVSYFNQVFGDASTAFSPIGLGLNTGVTDPALPGSPNIIIGPSGGAGTLTATATGFDPIGVTAPSGRNDITGHLDDDLTWVKGAHQFHFGGEVRQSQVDDFYQTGQRGTIYFDNSQGPWSGTITSKTSPCTTNPNNTAPNTTAIAALTDTTKNTLYLADFLAGCIDPATSTIVLGNPKRQVFVNTFADVWSGQLADQQEAERQLRSPLRLRGTGSLRLSQPFHLRSHPAERSRGRGPTGGQYLWQVLGCG